MGLSGLWLLDNDNRMEKVVITSTSHFIITNDSISYLSVALRKQHDQGNL